MKSWLGWGGGGTPTQLYSEGKMISSPAGLASTMNKFFLDKIKGLRNLIPAAVTDPLAKMKEAMANRRCSFPLSRVEENDVLKVIFGLKNSSASGVDFIDTRTVKLAAKQIALHCLTSSTFLPVPVPSQACGFDYLSYQILLAIKMFF